MSVVVETFHPWFTGEQVRLRHDDVREEGLVEVMVPVIRTSGRT
jgi:hypothetical protein